MSEKPTAAEILKFIAGRGKQATVKQWDVVDLVEAVADLALNPGLRTVKRAVKKYKKVFKPRR